MDVERQNIQIEGTVAVLVYQNPDNGYAVLRLETEDGVVTAVGCMPDASPGEELLLTGNWVTHQAYGRQFRADFVQRRLPSGTEGIFRYLASGAVKYVGPAKARDIVQRFGDAALDIIENDPERLSEIKGITLKRAREIGSAFRRQISLRRLIEFLMQNEISSSVAMELYRVWGDEALAAVRANPYVIAAPEFGADFSGADSLALRLGFEADCPERAEAALLFELSHNLGNGHTFIPREKLLAASASLIGLDGETLEESLECLCECGSIIRDEVAGQDACYLPEYFRAETYTARRILEMAAAPAAGRGGFAAAVSAVEREQGVSYSEGQRRAVELAGRRRVLAITGGPGTGKTTSVRGILALFDRMGLETALCAPTGRAAKRMSELTGREAATIHRLLGTTVSDRGVPVFEHDESDPLDADAVILDESSMVDIRLMEDLLRALRPDCRLILVGDCDQLPSVGPGNVFSDILRSGAVESVRLTEIFRQAGESRIVRSAHMINSGIVPDLRSGDGDFFFLQRSTPERAADTIVELFSERLPRNMGIDPSQIQVLSPTRRLGAGTHTLNLRLQEAVNPPGKGKREKIYGDFTYREGDKVMQIKNNYDIIWRKTEARSGGPVGGQETGCTFTETGTGIFNGDIGVIVSIDDVRETVTVEFDGRLVTYQYEQLSELEPAYAMTVHKSQGSEYRAVILAAVSGAPQLLVRGVLYTAVTRARELLIIVGDRAVVERMTLDDRRQKRYSGLRARLADVSGG